MSLKIFWCLNLFLFFPSGVSGEKVEIDPVAVRGTARLFRQRAVTYEADSIADCHLLEKKANGEYDYCRPCNDL